MSGIGGRARRTWVGTAAVAAVLISAGLVSVTPAGATAVPTIGLTPSSGLLNGQQVTVDGSGLAASSEVLAFECNLTPGQPTIGADGVAVPVGCSAEFTPGEFNSSVGITSATGTVELSALVLTGTVGPPAGGQDSAGRNAAADATGYPCPPTPAQVDDGDTCGITLQILTSADEPGDATEVSAPISFGTPVVTSPVLSATPSTGLVSGESVTVGGSGFTPDAPYVLSECNESPGEPPATDDNGLPGVACTEESGQAEVDADQGIGVATLDEPDPATDGTGALSQSYVIEEGNIGGSSASQAYPCPPTPAEVLAGGTCDLVVDDAAGERVSTPLDITGPIPVPTIAVSPSHDLQAGQVVSAWVTGLTPNRVGAAIECNLAPGQPTIGFDGIAAPVSCQNPFDRVLSDAAPDGTATASVTIVRGVTGPPTTGTDSAGGDATTDAAAYPCPPTPAQLADGVTCGVMWGDLSGDIASTPITFGPVPPPVPPTPTVPTVVTSTPGYRLVGADGAVFAYGGADFEGSAGGQALNRPIVGMTATPDGKGYWLVASDGGIFAYGDAGYFGSAGSQHLNEPIVGMATTPDGKGYWLVASDGGVFAYGDARFVGSAGSTTLNEPIVGMAATPDGKGYWLVASDGGIFAYGDAAFFGSTGGKPLNRPIVGMAATTDGRGYWLVASDGGIFSYGDARFEGSAGSNVLDQPIVGMAASPDGNGYWLVAADGGLFAYGDAPFDGSRSGTHLARPIVGMVAG